MWAGLALAVVGVAITSLVIAGVRALVFVTGLAILYLVPVMFVAIRSGWWPALLAAILAFISYDFLFVEPVFTFTIRDPEEWLSLIAFMFVAAVTSNLAAMERRRREEAARSAEQATLLYQLSHALATAEPDHAWKYVAEQVREAFGANGSAIQIKGDGRPWILAAAGAPIPDQAAVQMLGQRTRAGTGRRIVIHRQTRAPDSAVIGVPLRTGQHPIGVLRLSGRDELSADEERLAGTIAEQLATSIERERLRLEAQKAELLRRTDEIRQQLLASVSHDLRTPLASISASAESLLQPDVQWSDEDRKIFLTTIHGEASRLNRLVTNLLDVTRIESGALKPQKDWYDLAELAREAADRFRTRYPDRAVSVEAPEILAPIELDYVMIDEVLTNLLENAAKYTPLESPLEIRVQPSGQSQRLCIVDHGPGIPEGERERVFDKFYRLGRKSDVKGSGLGLAVTKGFVEAHEGRIWIDETPGGGATFCLDLPARSPDSMAAPVESEARV